MSPSDLEQFEAELKRLRLAKPPPEVVDRVSMKLSSSSARPAATNEPERVHWNWFMISRWLAPLGVAAVVFVSVYVKYHPRPPVVGQQQQIATSSAPLLKADKIEIDRQLVADFDAIANLPSGQPVRFRCEQWMDKVQWRDSAKGLVVEQTTPRLEIVPIRFETY